MAKLTEEPLIRAGHALSDYEACVQYASERGYRAMHCALVEDGYDPDVNWRELMEPPASQVSAAPTAVLKGEYR